MLNKTIFIGRVASEPEFKTLGDTTQAKFRLAVNRKYAKKGQQDVDFIQIELWGGSADFMRNYNVGKGRLVNVVGELRIDQVRTEDNRTNYFTKINANQLQVLDYAEDGQSQQAPAMNQPQDDFEGPELDINSDDLPF